MDYTHFTDVNSKIVNTYGPQQIAGGGGTGLLWCEGTLLSYLKHAISYSYKALHPLNFVESTSSQKDSLFGRSKKRDNSLTTSSDSQKKSKYISSSSSPHLILRLASLS